MSQLNTIFCDDDAAKRDTINERAVLWSLSSYQILQITPTGHHYGHGRSTDRFISNLDGAVVLQYTLKGALRIEYQGQELEVPAGYAYIFPSGVEPRWTNLDDPEYRCCWVNMTGSGLVEHWQLLREVYGPIIPMDRDGSAMRAFDKVIQIHEEQADVSAEAVAIHAFVMALFRHCESGHAVRLQPVERAVQHITRYPLHSHSLKEIASKHGVSREHLSRVFIQQFGVAPATWLRTQRFQHARELLHRTDMPIKEVAFQSGFGSVDSLARILYEHEGCSATEFRERR